MVSDQEAAVNLPHVPDSSAIPRLLHLVESSTRPAQVTAKHLAANGFAAPETKRLIKFLKALGLLSGAGVPTDLWDAYREADDRTAVLSPAVHRTYEPLFADGIDIASATDEELIGAIGDIAPGREVAQQVVDTFRALCSAAGIAATDTMGRSRRDVIDDVSRLMQFSVAEFEMARGCLAQDHVRAAIVAAWSSYAAMALAHLSADDFAAVRGPSPRRSTMTISELATRTPGRELIDLLTRGELIDPTDEPALVEMLKLRNDCAYPTLTVPDRAEGIAYLNAILTRSGLLAEKALT